MAQGSQKRITKVCGTPKRLMDCLITDDSLQELAELLSSPPAGITVSLADESDIFKWKVTMEGPADSPYAVSDWFPSHSSYLPTGLRSIFQRPSSSSNIWFHYAFFHEQRLRRLGGSEACNICSVVFPIPAEMPSFAIRPTARSSLYHH